MSMKPSLWDLCPYKKRYMRVCFFSLLYVSIQQKGVPLKTRKRLSPGIELAGILILDYPASRAVSNNFVLLMPPSLWYNLLRYPLTL